MNFYEALTSIEHVNVSPEEKFMQTTILAALQWIKEQFPGRCVDDINFSEMVHVLKECWPSQPTIE